MLPLEVGKLYSCSKYFLLLFPDKDTAADAATTNRAAAARRWGAAGATAAYWSKRFGKPVNYCDPKTPLLVLNTEQEYVEVLAGDKKGWIIYRDWLELEEIR